MTIVNLIPFQLSEISCFKQTLDEQIAEIEGLHGVSCHTLSGPY